MKNILIISYFFPPCNLTASQRVLGWANYLSNFGYYPTIVSRNWDIPINSPEDVLKSTGREVVHQKNDQYEVYYLPYVASIRDQIFSKNKDKKIFQKISKILTFKDQILENYFNRSIPFSNLYDFSLDLIQKEDKYKCLIVSGNPFVQFKFGFLLNKKTGIRWIADYRDDWNTSELISRGNGLKKIISSLQSKSERKWVKSSECIISVSPKYTSKIASFVNKNGEVILNGFDGLNENDIIETDKRYFTITYNGSLYPTQPIEIVINAIKKIILNKDVTLKIQLNFPGLGFDKTQKNRVEKAIKGIESNVLITDRILKEDVVKIQKGSDLLLMVSHLNIKGIPSSKMYEYIGLKKQILFYPNDHDIVEQTLKSTGLGVICNNEKEVYLNLLNLILLKQNENSVFNLSKIDQIEFYSRKNQTAILAQLIDRIIEI